MLTDISVYRWISASGKATFLSLPSYWKLKYGVCICMCAWMFLEHLFLFLTWRSPHFIHGRMLCMLLCFSNLTILLTTHLLYLDLSDRYIRSTLLLPLLLLHFFIYRNLQYLRYWIILRIWESWTSTLYHKKKDVLEVTKCPS